jgi:hypothetical protein
MSQAASPCLAVEPMALTPRSSERRPYCSGKGGNGHDSATQRASSRPEGGRRPWRRLSRLRAGRVRRIPVSEAGHDSRRRLRAELMGHMPALRTATSIFASPEDGSAFEVLSRVQGDDHGHRRRRPPITFQQLQIQRKLGYTVFASGNQFKRLFANSLSLTRSPNAPVVARNAG